MFVRALAVVAAALVAASAAHAETKPSEPGTSDVQHSGVVRLSDIVRATLPPEALGDKPPAHITSDGLRDLFHLRQLAGLPDWELGTVGDHALETLPPEARGDKPPAGLSLELQLALDRQRETAGLEPWPGTVGDIARDTLPPEAKSDTPPAGLSGDLLHELNNQRETAGLDPWELGPISSDPSGGSDGTSSGEEPRDPEPSSDGSVGSDDGAGWNGVGETTTTKIEIRQDGETIATGTHSVTDNGDGTITDVVDLQYTDGTSETTTTVTDEDGNVLSQTVETTDAQGNTTEVSTPPDDDEEWYTGPDGPVADAPPPVSGPGAIDVGAVIHAHNGGVVQYSSDSASIEIDSNANGLSGTFYFRPGVVDPAPDSDGSTLVVGGLGTLTLPAKAGPECFDRDGCASPDGPVTGSGGTGPISFNP